MNARQYRARCQQLGITPLVHRANPIANKVLLWLASTVIALLLASAPLLNDTSTTTVAMVTRP